MISFGAFYASTFFFQTFVHCRRRRGHGIVSCMPELYMFFLSNWNDNVFVAVVLALLTMFYLLNDNSSVFEAIG